MKLKGQLRDAIHELRAGRDELDKRRSELASEYQISHHMSLFCLEPWYKGIAIMEYIAKRLEVSTKSMWKIYYNKKFTT